MANGGRESSRRITTSHRRVEHRVVDAEHVTAGDGQITTTPEHPRGAMLRAYDKVSGQQVGAVFIPAPQSGNPMTYMVDGKQYIVVAVSGGSYSGEYIAFSLPN